MLNNCMNHIKQKKEKDKLSHKQYELIRKQKKDSALTSDWLRDNDFDNPYFNQTDIKILQTQKTAQILLTQHLNLLTTEQISQIKIFQNKTSKSKLLKKLKPNAAYPVLNIGRKINRQLFKQYKKIK